MSTDYAYRTGLCRPLFHVDQNWCARVEFSVRLSINRTRNVKVNPTNEVRTIWTPVMLKRQCSRSNGKTKVLIISI